MSRPLAADRPLIKPRGLSATAAARFGYYYADCETGAFFASVDGLKFANIPNLSFPQSHRCVLEPHPTERGGGLWLALGSNGLHFVADANVPGATFRAAVGIAAAHTVAVGAPPTSGAEPSVYIFGLRDSQVQGEGGEAGAKDLHVLASLDRAACGLITCQSTAADAFTKSTADAFTKNAPRPKDPTANTPNRARDATSTSGQLPSPLPLLERTSVKVAAVSKTTIQTDNRGCPMPDVPSATATTTTQQPQHNTTTPQHHNTTTPHHHNTTTPHHHNTTTPNTTTPQHHKTPQNTPHTTHHTTPLTPPHHVAHPLPR